MVGPCLNLEIGVVLKLPTFILHSVDIEEFSGLFHLFYRKLKPLCIHQIHEVFGGTGINQCYRFGSFSDGVNEKSKCHRFPCG